MHFSQLSNKYKKEKFNLLSYKVQINKYVYNDAILKSKNRYGLIINSNNDIYNLHNIFEYIAKHFYMYEKTILLTLTDYIKENQEILDLKNLNYIIFINYHDPLLIIRNENNS